MPDVSGWRRLGTASAVGRWILALASAVDAVFEDTRGAGSRNDDARPCSLTFVK